MVWTSLEPGRTAPTNPQVPLQPPRETKQGSQRHGFTQILLPLYFKHHKIYTQKKRMNEGGRHYGAGGEGETSPKTQHQLRQQRDQLPWSISSAQADTASPPCACQACEKEGEESEPWRGEEERGRAPSRAALRFTEGEQAQAGARLRMSPVRVPLWTSGFAPSG